MAFCEEIGVSADGKIMASYCFSDCVAEGGGEDDRRDRWEYLLCLGPCDE